MNEACINMTISVCFSDQPTAKAPVPTNAPVQTEATVTANPGKCHCYWQYNNDNNDDEDNSSNNSFPC